MRLNVCIICNKSPYRPDAECCTNKVIYRIGCNNCGIQVSGFDKGKNEVIWNKLMVPMGGGPAVPPPKGWGSL